MATLPASVLRHVVDVHCHPTDAPRISDESMARLDIRVCAMSTHKADQRLVRDLALKHPSKVIPCFGYHPWFTHMISPHPVSSKYDHYRQLLIKDDTSENISILEELLPSLPEPITIGDIISDLRRNFQLFSTTTALLGEVGLDKAFRVAFDYFASPRKLTPFAIPLDHQLAILEAQLDLAVELRRNVSLHSVKCPSATVDLLKRMKLKHGRQWENIRIDVHSCSMNPQVWIDLQKRHSNIFLSLSTVINGRSNKLNALIEACSPERILIESDFNDIDMSTQRCIDMLFVVAEVKGWHVEDQEWSDEVDKADWGVVRRLEANWKTFRDGKVPESSSSGVSSGEGPKGGHSLPE